MKNLALKLLELQKQALAITKDSQNPFFHSTYFDINKLLEVIKPILSKQGLTLIQPLSNILGRPAIKTILFDTASGEFIEDTITLPDLQDSQKMGVAITYYRRYGLVSLLGLESVDDDGNSAVAKAPVKPVSKPVEDENKLPWDENLLDTSSAALAIPQKVLGGTCVDCGNGKYKKSAAGNLYCSEKCWLQK